MIRRYALEERLSKLQEYLDLLNNKRSVTRQEFLADIELQAIVERFLELSIQAVNDIGSHIIADKQLGRVETYSDIPRIFVAKGLIKEESGDTWIKMCGFRNVLARDYLTIDKEIVFSVLQKHKDVFAELLRAFEGFL